MITSQKLNKNMVAISGHLKGVKCYKYNYTSKDLEEEIWYDITSYFTSIKKVTISVTTEDVDDERTLQSCAIFNLELLLQFKGDVDWDDVIIIEKYLDNNFVLELD